MKKFICMCFAVLYVFGISNRIFAEKGYKAELCLGESYRDGSGDFYAQFSVENPKGVTTYFVDILRHNSIPVPYGNNIYTVQYCQLLLNKCRNKEIELGKLLSVEIDKSLYLKLFNLTKAIKSKKIKDRDLKLNAFDELIPIVLNIYKVIDK